MSEVCTIKSDRDKQHVELERFETLGRDMFANMRESYVEYYTTECGHTLGLQHNHGFAYIKANGEVEETEVGYGAEWDMKYCPFCGKLAILDED